MALYRFHERHRGQCFQGRIIAEKGHFLDFKPKLERDQ